jgi:hypothetical protein
LRDDEAFERVVPGGLGEVADRLGVLGGDAEQFHALPGEPLPDVRRHGQLAEHGLDETWTPCADVVAFRA